MSNQQEDSQSTEPVFCIDCGSYNPNELGRCIRIRNPVTGEREQNDCEWMRKEGPCGIDARLFTPAEEWKKKASREKYEESVRPITFKEELQRAGCLLSPGILLAFILWLLWVISC